MKRLRYESIPEMSCSQIEAALLRDRPDELLYAVLSAVLHSQDRIWAEGLCIRLAHHAHPIVRGNAILGLGHIARTHRRLGEARVKPIVEAAFADAEAYVRGHAHDAADDIEHFLGWSIRRPAAEPADSCGTGLDSLDR